MTKIVELFGRGTSASPTPDWKSIVAAQECPFVAKRCYKVRKSQSDVSIGTCTLDYGGHPIITCPLRLLERQQIFSDCLHLLSHEPGNELHLVPEISVPGGSVDYVLASVLEGKVRDFVGMELQTLDTTGTVWPERQRFLKESGFTGLDSADLSNPKSFGMNWRMTAKTTLVQLHHKVETFESVGKRLVLVIQDRLLEYMKAEFSFDHLVQARNADPMHFHAYKFGPTNDGHQLQLSTRLSTDTAGVAKCLGMRGEANVELTEITGSIERKLSDATRYALGHAPQPVEVPPEE